MKVLDRFKVSKSPEGPKKYTFEFTGPGLVSVAVVAVLGIVWLFILGVLVGRGYKPENAVPQVAQIMPSAPAPAQPETQEPPKVLKPEELQFMDNLQGRKVPETVTVDSTKPQDHPPGQTPPAQGLVGGGSGGSALDKTPSVVPKGQVATAPAQPDKKAPAMGSAAPAAPAPAAKKDDKAKGKDAKSGSAAAKDAKDSKDSKDSKSGKHQAVYQVSALDKKDLAQQEADKLGKKGLKATVEEAQVNSKTVWRVVVRVKGTDQEIASALEKAGVKKPILREKKPL